MKQLPNAIQQTICEANKTDNTKDISLINYIINLDYNAMSENEILREIIPESIEVPTSYETIGHIARFTLRPQQLPYKYIIGQVYSDVCHRNKNEFVGFQ